MKISYNKCFRESISKGNIKELQKYIDIGCDINQTWGDNEIIQGNALIWSCFLDDFFLVEILIKYIDVNKVENLMLRSPLHFSSINGNIEIINLLLKNGANINIQDNNLETALHMACWKGKEDVVRLLIEKKIDINIKNADNQTAYDIAIKYKNFKCAQAIKENQ